MLSPAILQFGTGRFLLAHVDLFVSEALAAGQAAGGILVVQTTRSPASTARTDALATGVGYPVRIRGFEKGQPVDRTVQCHAVSEAVRADSGWDRVRQAILSQVQVIVSNTAETGYELDPADGPALLQQSARAPRSFPAKLLLLLHWRWRSSPQAPLSILPCELVEKNGDTLRSIVAALAIEWRLPAPFVHWLGEHCVWANTLVDRIVSEQIEPVGAIAEPYALWAVQRKPGLVMPCAHPAIVLTDDLDHYARLKLFLLNGGHTFLAERWQLDGLAADFTVAEAMNDAALRRELEGLWAEEIVPVFAAIGKQSAAEHYLVTLRERLLNPFLAHRLADIAQNHAKKKQRRFAPIVSLAAQHGLPLPLRRLRAALDREHS
jgi:tagaturonate reductase